jgi:hypothetical protein
VKAINGYNQKNLIVGINPTAAKAKWINFRKLKNLQMFLKIISG